MIVRSFVKESAGFDVHSVTTDNSEMEGMIHEATKLAPPSSALRPLGVI